MPVPDLNFMQYTMLGAEDFVENEQPSTELDAEDYNLFFDIFREHTKRQPSQLRHVSNEHALIAVVKESSDEVLYFTDKFFLTNLQEARNEKAQVIETFGEPHVSFFDERVKTYQGAGVVLEADSNNLFYQNKYRWGSSLNKFYEEHLRGTELIKNGNIVHLHVGNYILEGYFLNLIQSTSANDPYKKQFSFNFLVKKHTTVVSDELDALYSIARQLNREDKADFLRLSNDLKSKQAELTGINEFLVQNLETSTDAEVEEKENRKRVLEDTINNLRYQLKNLILLRINGELDG